MSTDLAVRSPEPPDLSAIERVIVAGDLSKLSQDERWTYYSGVCRSLGLNPFTTPFQYLSLNGKLVLYATKGATDQLRGMHHISVSKPAIDLADGLCMVSVTASDPSGRQDSDLGITNVEGLKGEAKANAIMRAVTKSKRRVTLSMLGLGMLDESEIDSIPNAHPIPFEVPEHMDMIPAQVDADTGEIPFPELEPMTPPSANQLALYQRGIRRANELGLDCARWEINADATGPQVQQAIDEMIAAVRAKEAAPVGV